MSKKKTRHSAKDGKFVSKEFAEANPEQVVEVTNHDHKEELEKFRTWIIENGKDINSETVVSEYLTNPDYLRD